MTSEFTESSPVSIEMLQSILEQMPFGVLLLNRRLEVVSINAFLRERFSLDLRWNPHPPLEALLGEDPQTTLYALRQALELGQPVTLSTRFHRSPFRLQSLPGSPLQEDVPQQVIVLPVRETGAVSALAVLVQDVSDRVLTERELRREIEKWAFLHDLDVALSTLKIEECIKVLVTRPRQFFKAKFSALLAFRDGQLEVVATDGLELPNDMLAEGLSRGIAGWAARNRQSVRVSDVRQDSRYVALFPTIRSEMAVPLIVHGECIGAMIFQSDVPAAFSQEDLHLLELAAFSAANALHNARMYARVDYWRSYYEAVTNQTGDVLYTVDRECRITGVNTAWDEFARENGGEAWSSTYCIGKPLLSAFDSTFRSKWQTLCAELLDGKRTHYQEELPCHAPGKERWLSLRANPLKNEKGEVAGIVFSTHDITEHVLAERQLRAMNHQLETLLRLAQTFNQNPTASNPSQIAVGMLAETLQADCVTILQYDDEKEEGVVLASFGAVELPSQGFLSSREQARAILERYGKTGIIYNLPEAAQTINLPGCQQDGWHGVLYSLIEYEGKIIGALNIFTRDVHRQFGPEELSLVQAITLQIGLAMENARLYHELLNQATTDGLTGLANRRQMEDLLAAEIYRCQRYRRSFSVLMIDLDHFKCYNDTYGHAMGDRLLKQVAALFKNNLRTGDVPTRYGGDEFVIILPETNLAGASCIARRLQKAAAEIALPLNHEKTCPKITLSIGIATYPGGGDSPSSLVHNADLALYRAKQLGRDRVEIFIEG